MVAAPPATAAFEGGISLGEGGDGTNANTGFHEGAIIAFATSDATDNAIAANIASFYSNDSVGGTASEPHQTPVVDLGHFAGTPNPSSLHPSSASPPGALIIALGFDVGQSGGTTGAVTDTQDNTYARYFCQCSRRRIPYTLLLLELSCAFDLGHDYLHGRQCCCSLFGCYLCHGHPFDFKSAG